MQPNSGYQWYIPGTAGPGTTLAKDSPITLAKIVIPGTYVGTMAFYDSSTAAGTAATNLVFSLGLPATSIPQSLDLNLQMKNGLVCTATGTPAVVLGLK